MTATASEVQSVTVEVSADAVILTRKQADAAYFALGYTFANITSEREAERARTVGEAIREQVSS